MSHLKKEFIWGVTMHDKPKTIWHWVFHLAALCSLATLCLLVISMTRPIVNVATTQVSVQACQAIELVTTGYAIGKPYSSITKSGNPVVSLGYMQIDNMSVFSVAVDPNLIPLGSKVFIPGLGIGLCMDTGKAIKGLDMDICFQTMQQAMEWGRQKKLVFLLEKGVSNESKI